MSDTLGAFGKTRLAIVLLCVAYALPCFFWYSYLDGTFFGLGKSESTLGTMFLVLAIAFLAVGALSLVTPFFPRAIGLSRFPEAELNAKRKPTFRQKSLQRLSNTLLLAAFLTFVFGWACMTGVCVERPELKGSAVSFAFIWVVWWGILPAALGGYCARDKVLPVVLGLLASAAYLLIAVYAMARVASQGRKLTEAFTPWIYLILSVVVVASACMVLFTRRRRRPGNVEGAAPAEH